MTPPLIRSLLKLSGLRGDHVPEPRAILGPDVFQPEIYSRLERAAGEEWVVEIQLMSGATISGRVYDFSQGVVDLTNPYDNTMSWARIDRIEGVRYLHDGNGGVVS